MLNFQAQDTDMKVFKKCRGRGISGVTDVFLKTSPTGRADFPTKFVMRIGIRTSEDKINLDSSPFDVDFNGSVVEGKGYTQDIAFEKLKVGLGSLADTLFD